MAVWNDAFNLTPAGSDDPGEGDDRIREVKAEVDGRVNQEHVFHDTATTGASVHRAGSARMYYQAAEPTLRPDGITALGASDTGRLWMDSDDDTIKGVWTGAAFVEPSINLTDAAISGDVTIGGTCDITGNATAGGTFDITGNTTIGGTLEVTGAITATAGYDTLDCYATNNKGTGLIVVTTTANTAVEFYLKKPIWGYIDGVAAGTGDLDIYINGGWQEIASVDVPGGQTIGYCLNPGYYQITGDPAGGVRLVCEGAYGVSALDTASEIVTEV